MKKLWRQTRAYNHVGLVTIMVPKQENESEPVHLRDTIKLLEPGLSATFWNYTERVTGQRSLKKLISQGLLLTLLSDFPSIWGVVLRRLTYRKVLGSMGENCFIGKNVRFRVPGRIFLGNRIFIGENACLDACYLKSKIRVHDGVHIGRNSILRAGIGQITINEGAIVNRFVYLDGNGGIQIGKNSLLGNKVEIISGDHIFDDPNTPIKFQGTKLEKVTIGEDVWLGASTIVLPGVTIGNGSVVGAGSVVTEDIPNYSVAIGTPAKIVRKRGEMR